MSRPGAVVIFAGQGSLHRAPFQTGILRAQLDEVSEEIGAAGQFAGVLGDGPLPPDETLALFVFAASVAHYRVLHNRDSRPVALLGHGFGEISALVCGGRLSASQGAAIVRHRVAALERTGGQGRMIVATTTRAMADHLVDLAGRGRVAVAAENSITEIVLSGTTTGIDAVEALARQRAIPVRLLNAHWPLHCAAAMQRAATDLAGRLGQLKTAPSQTPVFSPILARYYLDSDDLAACLARHLTSPVRFADAFHTLWSDGIRTFVPCGPLRGLDRCIAELTRRRPSVRAQAGAAADLAAGARSLHATVDPGGASAHTTC
uniref:[acyl-carrier-protein] S-malonyltransferase n=1 Tax=uncultured Acidobacteria bacterium A3 TaxID=1036853 RepID=F8TTH9_9BACT|nr:acyltransferase domain protein [uncultured Acidobacteria bacterium A3]